MIHVVNKGKEGEREVCRLLNGVLQEILTEMKGLDEQTRAAVRSIVQRNQNQSAVGGGDINLLGLSIEVKRQETLSVDTWWKQAQASAARNGDKPVLMYRQNRKAWHVVMDGLLPVAAGYSVTTGARVTIDLDTFLRWFGFWAERKISYGEVNRV